MRRSSGGPVARPVALLVALLAARAAAYTVDCNQDYADCAKELSSLTEEDDQMPYPINTSAMDLEPRPTASETVQPIRSFAPVINTTDSSAKLTDTPYHDPATDFGSQRAEQSLEAALLGNKNMEMSGNDKSMKTPSYSTETTDRVETPHKIDSASQKTFEPQYSAENKDDSPYMTQNLNRSSIEKAKAFPKGRLLNLSVDELQSFANALHNVSLSSESKSKKTSDLSDVSLDDDELDYNPHEVVTQDARIINKQLPDNFYTNLQAPFLSIDQPEGLERSEDTELCSENGVNYKLGNKVDRGCEESCECAAHGVWECSPRCRQPYIRRGRRLSDPLCFESPVDECCSIVACATGNEADLKAAASTNQKTELCRYGNNTYTAGQKWDVGCEQLCSCEPNSVVTCKPRCAKLSASDHCINVQDPHDICCHVQVCDVTHDAHEDVETAGAPAAHPTTIEDRMDSDFNDLLVSTDKIPAAEKRQEPILSLKVNHNQSVVVTLGHANSSEKLFHLQISDDKGLTYQDINLNSSNMLNRKLNPGNYILRTKETGNTMKFVIPEKGSSDQFQSVNAISPDMNGTTVGRNVSIVSSVAVGCMSQGVRYSVGEEFRIGCSELCECVGPGEKECAALECPSHVGLELVLPACVRWAPDPPDWKPRPPACCPTKMRCLSDGSCNYHGNKIPNWSEVPVSLTGCEQRCFCESGTLDCQNICSPLPDLPPQTLRCQSGYKPAPVNISDDDCCKQWGCLPIEGQIASESQGHSMPQSTSSLKNPTNFVTPVPPNIVPSVLLPTINSEKPVATDPLEDLRQLIPEIKPISMYSKYMKHPNPLIKLHTHGDGDFQMHPKLLHKINFTKSMMPHIQTAHYKFHGPLTDAYVQLKSAEHSLEGKSPSANKAFGVTMMNNVPTDHAHATAPYEKLQHNTKFTQPTDPLQILYQYPTRPKVSHTSPVHLKDNQQPSEEIRYFEPNLNRTSIALPHSKPVLLLNSGSREANLAQQSIHIPYTKQIKLPPAHPLDHPDYMFAKPDHTMVLHNLTVDRKTHYTPQHVLELVKNPHKHEMELKTTHILQKVPNPYQTALMHHESLASKRPSAIDYKYDLHNYNNMQDLHSTFAPLDVAELLRQLEQTHQEKRMPDRSPQIDDLPTPDLRLTGPHIAPPSNPKQSPPIFLPTVSPEIHFPTEDDLGDYDQNIIHRPQPPPPKAPPTFNLPSLPPNGFEVPDNKKLSVISLEADSPTSVKMLFGIPSVLVGLRGRIDLRYTDTDDEDISHWQSQVFAPTDEVLTTARLDFALTGLKPSTLYKLQGKLYLHSLPLEPVSSVYSVRTPDVQVEEKRRAVDTQIAVVEVNATVAHIAWRHFTEDELAYIDGIQVRYRPLEQPIYSMTELLHHGRSSIEIRELRPGSQYEASLVLIPPPRSPLELYDPRTINFTTPEFHDMYNWTVFVDAHTVGSGSVELHWRGVPAPPERFVRVYRAAHTCDGTATPAHREHDSFKLADRDQPPSLLLTGLDPDTKCRVWLELFLTNGKVKISNVLDITTKSEDTVNTIDNEVLASSVAGSRSSPRGDYYSALVVVGVVAALGALTSLLLLLVVVRRHRPHSVSITTVPSAPRATSLPPYDNPAYKLELQQETMDL